MLLCVLWDLSAILYLSTSQEDLDFNIRGKAQTKLTRQVTEEAERSSFVLWLRRKDKAWKDVLGRTGRNVEEGRRLTDETALQTLGTFRGAEKHAKLSSS
ncbi:hypothetical protein Bbelb_214910 [Branchiostoma belcheri]|nr:hypothetical protein Bbelb_214910 [Branchiostoma belcheri]